MLPELLAHSAAARELAFVFTLLALGTVPEEQEPPLLLLNVLLPIRYGLLQLRLIALLHVPCTCKTKFSRKVRSCGSSIKTAWCNNSYCAVSNWHCSIGNRCSPGSKPSVLLIQHRHCSYCYCVTPPMHTPLPRIKHPTFNKGIFKHGCAPDKPLLPMLPAAAAPAGPGAG